ncbi:MAG: hypothetical protein WCH39_04845 [Schlesneria sp.]
MDEQLKPYFAAVEQSKADVANKTLAVTNAETALATAQAVVDQARQDLETAKATNKTDGENLVTAVKNVYGVA